jgi:hypothetical protein
VRGAFQILLLLASGAQAAVEVGSESWLSFPASGKFNLHQNTRPRDGETVTINPPRFSWSYTPSPTNAASDQLVYEYCFQLSSNNFSTVTVDSGTNRINCWNFLGPLPAGVTQSWRVIYYNATNHLPVWTNTQTFVVSDGASTWDRSFMADTDYWATNAVHPRLTFNAGSRQSLFNFLRTNAAVQADWLWASNYAYTDITNSWWLTNPVGTVGGGNWGHAIFRAAFVYQMTRDARFVTGPTNVCARLSELADYVRTNHYERYDMVTLQLSDCFKALALGYDWLYTNMTTAQKTNVLGVLERASRYALKGVGAFETPLGAVDWDASDPLGSYTGGFYVDPNAQFKNGSAHGEVTTTLYYLGALAAYEDGPWCRQLAELMVNRFISRGHCFSDDGHLNSGRGYSAESIFNTDMLTYQMIASQMFPGLHLEKNPYWIEQAAWWNYMCPVGFWEKYEPWGDLGHDGYLQTPKYKHITRDLANFVGSGTLRMNWTNAFNYWGDPGQVQPVWRLATEFHYPPPALQTNGTNARIFPLGGWVVSSKYEPNTTRGFNAGAGFILSGNPGGWTGVGHGHPSALDVQLWAYGANLTESGYGFTSASKAGWTHNIPAYNGTSLFNDGRSPQMDYLARITAFTNTSDFTYAAVDGTRSYAVVDYPDDTGGWLMFGEYANHHRAAEASALTRMRRHILFPHQKYFVLYDECTALTNSTFSWIWQIPGGLTNQGNGDFTYLATNTVSGSNVVVWVKQVVSSSLISVTNLSDRRSVLNPITGEDYAGGALWTTGNYPPNQWDHPTCPAFLSVFVVSNGVNRTTVFYFVTNQADVTATRVYAGLNANQALTNMMAAVSNSFAGCFDYEWRSATQVRMYSTEVLSYFELVVGCGALSGESFPYVEPRADVLWVSNKNPATNFHFLTVIVPVKPGEDYPEFQRLDDRTVIVSYENIDTTITFGTNYTGSVDYRILLDGSEPVLGDSPGVASTPGQGRVISGGRVMRGGLKLP